MQEAVRGIFEGGATLRMRVHFQDEARDWDLVAKIKNVSLEPIPVNLVTVNIEILISAQSSVNYLGLVQTEIGGE